MADNYDHIRKHKIQPPERSWRAIREKMARRKDRQKVAFYRNLSIAAGIIAIFSFTIGFTGQWFPGDYTDEVMYVPSSFEDLPVVKDDPFYDYSKILAMEKVQIKSSDPEISPEYQEN